MNPNSPDPLHGLNPADLMAAAAMPTDADTQPLPRCELPSLHEITVAFPDLEILDLIGHGGMSAVFKARQPKLDRVVALKVLPKSLAATPGFAERFTREGRVLARLNHPSIVTVHDFGESGGFYFLLMEFVDGVNLRQAMRAGRFTPEQALQIIPAICDALQFAHSQGVLHRDIKPENILLDAKGKVKIADFGIAKIIGEDGGDAMLLTQSGAKLGTAPYMAPEQIEQPSSVDHRADIYSLGVVFYEMLTGELPLGRFAAPSEFAAVGGKIDEIVFRALEKERTRRQQSAGEFKTQIEGAGGAQAPRRKFRPGQPYEYKSKRMIAGLPLLHVIHGRDPETGRMRTAHGFIAIGDKARGFIACGGIARGGIAFGGVATGVVTCGGLGIGLFSFGGLAIALLLAWGGIAIGALANGGLALGYHACGGVAAGWHAMGGLVFAHIGAGGSVHAEQVVKELQLMHPLTQWLYSMTVNSSLLGVMWIPLCAALWMVQWWARNEAAIEAGELPKSASSARIFWLVPALLAACAVFWVMLVSVATGPGDFFAHASSAVVPFLVTSAGLVIFLAAVPLWLRLVPVNPIYGFRLPSTMISESRWYDANAYAGKQLFQWSLSIIIAGWAGFHQLPRHQPGYPWAALTVVLFAIGVVLVSSLWWLRHHPIDGPVKRESRLAKFAGNAAIALFVAFFIKGFIFEPYRVAGGAETGVTKGSHWIASKIDTGFSTGNLVVYEHESGQAWIARVVARERMGLLLKRGGSAEEFFVPWEKIIGKMLFSHFSPDALKQAGAPINATITKMPVSEGSSKASQQKPVLRFLRLKRNDAGWQWPLHSPDGKPVSDEESKRLVASSIENGVSSKNADDCWLQLWFEHPDFDRHSQLRAEITDANGQPLKDREGMTAAPVLNGSAPMPPLLCFALSPGRVGKLPSHVTLTLLYSVGQWELGSELPADYNGSMSLGTGCLLAAFGDDPNHRAFVSWSKRGDDDVLYDAVALLKSGHRIGSSGWSRSGSSGQVVESVIFPEPLREIESFQIRSRRVQTAVFANVVLPPLPNDANEWVIVEGGVSQPGPVRWRPGLTAMEAVAGAGGISWRKPKLIRLVRDGKAEDITFNLSEDWKTKPGDKIIIPE